MNSNVVLKLYNKLGEEVIALVDEFQDAGFHSAFFTLNSSLSGGVYFYQLKTENFIETKKMIILNKVE